MRRLAGNASSQHWAELLYIEPLSIACRQVAQLLVYLEDLIVFTTGGNESNNFPLKGLFFSSSGRGRHSETSKVEHPSVIGPCEFLRRFGGQIRTALVTIKHVNNEIGTIKQLEEISRIAREHGVPFHADAAQRVGKIPVNVETLGVDQMTIAGHSARDFS